LRGVGSDVTFDETTMEKKFGRGFGISANDIHDADNVSSNNNSNCNMKKISADKKNTKKQNHNQSLSMLN
jgi:hypothetical protein